MKERPEFSPCESAVTHRAPGETYSMWKDLKLLCKNSSFWYYVLNFTLIHGIYTALGATINNVARPFDYTAKESSVFGCVCLLSGLFAGFVFSKYLDEPDNKQRRLMIVLHMIGIGSLLSYILLLFSLKPNNNLLITLNISMLGIFNVPVTPIGFYAAAELSKPVSEVMSAGVIMTSGMIDGVLMTYLISFLIDGSSDKSVEAHSVYAFLIIVIVMLVVACLAMLKVRHPKAAGKLTGNESSSAV